jgi:predicted RNA-binding protein
MNYIVIEMIIDTAGDFSVKTNTFTEKQLAEADYYTKLATGAVSNANKYTVSMLNDDGILLYRQSFTKVLEQIGTGEFREIVESQTDNIAKD